MWQRWIRALLGIVLALVCASALHTQPVPIGLVNQAMDQVLLETGNPFLRVIKQGSWVSGQSYRNPLTMLAGASDHDARLFISLDDLSPEQARATWIGFKTRLTSRVEALARAAGYSTAETSALMRSINLYPPAQMLKDVANNEQALAAFWRANNFPSLAVVGEEGAEGIFTKATKFIRQRYEMGSRVSVSALVVEEGDDVLRLVRRDNANLEHMIEGIARENLEGYIQATEYTMAEAQKAIRQGNLELAQKNLRRMREYHQGARRLTGVKLEGSMQHELQRLNSQIDELVTMAFGGGADARQLIAGTKAVPVGELAAKAHVELAALEGMIGRTAIKQRMFWKGVLEAEGKWAALRQDMELASTRLAAAEGSTAARMLTKHWVNGLFALWELSTLPEAIRKEGTAKATARLVMTVGSLASMQVMLLDIAARMYMWVGELLVDYIAGFGYDAVVSRQDCGDLIAGLYTVPGREANIEDRSCEQIAGVRELACRVYDHHGLRQHLNLGRKFQTDLLPPLLGSLLGCHARAAAKHYDDVESRHDAGVAEALMNKCMEPVVRSWLEGRQLMVGEVDAIRQSIAERALRLSAAPARLGRPGVVRLATQETMNLPAAEKDLGDRAACMGGVRARPVFSHSHTWTVNGQAFARTYDRGSTELNLTAPGTYEICVVQEIDWRLSGVPITLREDALEGKVARRGCTTVSVDLPPGAAPPTTPAPGFQAPPQVQAPSCSYEYGPWGECNRSSRKQTRSVLRATPAGCLERAKPVLEQACNPGPGEDEKRNNYFNCLCRCSSGWAGHIGVFYDPEQKSVPECKSSGPCIGGLGAFGCSSRHFFNSTPECAKGCWEGAYGKTVPFDPTRAAQLAKEENRKYKAPLRVALKASKNPAEFGDIVALTAEAADGSGGYRFSWGGCAQDAKDNTAKVLNTRSCRACQASVTATDSDGDSASANLTLQCTGLRVRLTKENPRENRIPVGGKASFLAEAFSGDQPATGTLFYVWERNPDVIFGDPKNPAYETRGGAQSRNTALFGRPGNIPVWVSVLKEVEGRKVTVGESTQIMMEVVRPRLSLSAQPRDALVGQEVQVTVQEDPRMSDDMLSFWWEIAGEASQAGPMPNVPNARAYSFRPKSDRPVTVTVHAKSRDGGDEIGIERITLQPRRAGVTVSGPRLAGPPPMIWKEGVGLVPVPQQVAEHQRVEFAVAVVPDSGPALRYSWTVAPEGCTLSAPFSRETGVTCSKAGGYTVSAVVRNAEGAELGSGTGSLSVTVTAAEIQKGKSKEEVTRKLEQAKQLWTQGRIEDALALLDTTRAQDKDLAAPLVQQALAALKKLGAEALQKGDAALATRRFEQALRLSPNDAEARQQLQQAQALAHRQKASPGTSPAKK